VRHELPVPTNEPRPSTGPGEARPPTLLSLLAKPLIIVVLLAVIVFIIYPAFADVLAGMGIRLPRF
jgi:hypothetical protein